MKRLTLVLIAGSLPTMAFAQATCEERLEEIDARIASGNYPDYNVQLAQVMRDSMTQLCGMGMADEQMLDEMMDGFEDVLPVKTEEEKLAERQAKGAVAKASRDARKAAEAARVNARPDSGLNSVTGSGRSMASGFVDRNEDMLRFWTWDWDVYKGNARVLYETRPSRVQLGRPDWQTYVYVVETTPEGSSTQFLITSKQAQENSALALRRGHAEVLLQRQTGADFTPTTLERWSTSGHGMISSISTPVIALAEADKIRWMPFRGPTSDGNVMFASAFNSDSGLFNIAWYEASPEGRTLGSGMLPADGAGFDSLYMTPSRNGGGAIPLMFGADEEVVRKFGGAEVKATIMKEHRLLVIDNDASSARTSAVLGRFVMPTQVDMESMRYMPKLEHELMANRSIESLNVGPHAVPMIQPVGDGYVLLSKFTGNRKRTEPIHGHWLIWLGSDEIEREVYLNPLAEDLSIDFVTFTVTESDEIILYGNSKEHTGTDYLVLLDSLGKPRATSAVKQPKNGKIEGMVADDDGVWLFGHGYPTDKFSHFRFWSERIEF